MERVSDSKMVWDELVSLYPESARVYFERGCFLRNINDVEGALDDFMTAVTLAPEVPAYLAMRADAYSALGMSEKAKADYQKITEIEPDAVALIRRELTLQFCFDSGFLLHNLTGCFHR